MNADTYLQSLSMLEQLPLGYFVRNKLADYLSSCLSSSVLLNATIHVSSDVIEVLFGKFKAIRAHSRGNEFNRSVLTIPLLTKNLPLAQISEALNATSIKELAEFDQKYVGKTIRKAKWEAFGKKKCKNHLPKPEEPPIHGGFEGVAGF